MPSSSSCYLVKATLEVLNNFLQIASIYLVYAWGVCVCFYVFCVCTVMHTHSHKHGQIPVYGRKRKTSEVASFFLLYGARMD